MTITGAVPVNQQRGAGHGTVQPTAPAGVTQLRGVENSAGKQGGA